MVTSSAVVGSSAISSFGLQAQRHGDHHALAHAAGELVRIVVHARFGVGDVHQPQHLDGALESPALRDSFSCRRSTSAICSPTV